MPLEVQVLDQQFDPDPRDDDEGAVHQRRIRRTTASSLPITSRIAMMPKIPPAMITHVFDDIATATRIESTANTISVSSTLTTVAQNAERPNAARACGMLRRSSASPPPKKCLTVR